MSAFVFEETPWDATLQTLRDGGSVAAARLLMDLEGEAAEALTEAFEDLRQRHIALELGDLDAGASGSATAVRLRREAELTSSGRLLQELPQEDPLRIYLEELAHTPALLLLPQTLADRYLSGEADAATQLVNGYLARVVELAKGYAGRGVLLLDLIQEGSLGLWQAILCYTGGDFAAHADWWIRQSMAQAIVQQARANGIGKKLQSAMEDYRAADRSLLDSLGRNPTREEIAQSIGISPQDAMTVEKMLRDAQALERVQRPPQEEPDAEQAVEDTAYFHSRQRIAELLSGLDAADARLLTLRFGLDGTAPLSPEQVGARMNLTPEEVTAREAAALAALRAEA